MAYELARRVELLDIGRVHAALEVVGGVGLLDDGVGGGEAVVGFGGVDRLGGLLGAVVSVNGDAAEAVGVLGEVAGCVSMAYSRLWPPVSRPRVSPGFLKSRPRIPGWRRRGGATFLTLGYGR